MEELSFKIVKIVGEHDEVLARVGNLFVYPHDHVEMRQGARIIAKSKE